MKLLEKKTVLETHPFNVEELNLEQDGKPLAHPYHRLVAPDWVNVLPVTTERKAVLIRQYRAGAMAETLEIPGGVIDADEKDPTMAAAREMEEETGYTSQRLLPLGSINPNPAIQNNKVHFFLALAAAVNSERRLFPDEQERIKVELFDVDELDELVRTGQMNHALCGLCAFLAKKYL